MVAGIYDVLPEDIFYIIPLWLDQEGFLAFGLCCKMQYLIHEGKVRSVVGVLPYRTGIPGGLYSNTEPIDGGNIRPGLITCIEKSGNGLLSRDLPFIVVHNDPDSQYLGVIFPFMHNGGGGWDISIGDIEFGPCRVETGIYLHREHLRLARSSNNKLTKIMIDDIRGCLVAMNSYGKQDEYLVCKINKHDFKTSYRTFNTIKNNIRLALYMSDLVRLNPTFLSESDVTHIIEESIINDVVSQIAV